MRAVLVVVIIGFLAGPVAGQPRDRRARISEDNYRTRYSVVAGFGVEGFIESHMRDTIGVGPAWNVRAIVGNPQSVSVEVFYVGSRQPIKMGGDALLGTGVRGQMRVNVYPEARFDPFFYIGAGWSRFSVSGRTADSLLAAHDDVIELPLGLGLAYRIGSFIADVRGGVTAVSAPDLLPNPMPDGSQDSYTMHRFAITADVGCFL